MFTFTPRTKEEIHSLSLWPEGTYDFTVMTAEEVTSRSGNPMLKLTLNVMNQNGKTRLIYDNLMDNEFMAFKLRHFCIGTGLQEEYRKGSLNVSDCLNRSGKLKLIIKKDKEGKFPDKNEVSDYIEGFEIPPKEADSMEDDINF